MHEGLPEQKEGVEEEREREEQDLKENGKKGDERLTQGRNERAWRNRPTNQRALTRQGRKEQHGSFAWTQAIDACGRSQHAPFGRIRDLEHGDICTYSVLRMRFSMHIQCQLQSFTITYRFFVKSSSCPFYHIFNSSYKCVQSVMPRPHILCPSVLRCS